MKDFICIVCLCWYTHAYNCNEINIQKIQKTTLAYAYQIKPFIKALWEKENNNLRGSSLRSLHLVNKNSKERRIKKENVKNKPIVWLLTYLRMGKQKKQE